MPAASRSRARPHLARIAGLRAVVWLVAVGLSTGAVCGRPPASSVDAALEAKARRIERAILSRCVLPDGYFAWYTLAPDLVDARTRLRAGVWPNWPNPRLLFDHFEPGRHPDVGPEAYHLYENSNYAAGKFLAAMAYRYAATREPAAAAAARVAFTALCRPFDWAIAAGEPGFFPKPYGGMRGWFSTPAGYHETSLDQTIAACYGLWEFSRRVATAAERERIGRYFQIQGHWWIDHGYVYMYTGKRRHQWNPAKPYRSAVLKLLMPMHAGAVAGRDAELLEEVRARMGQAFAAGTLPLGDQYMPETKDFNQWAHAAAYFMTESDIADRRYWLDLIAGYWRAGKSTLLPDTGLSVAMGRFDAARWRVEPFAAGQSSDPQWGYQGPVPSPSSSCENAWLALLAHELGLAPDGVRFARGVLDKLDETNLAEIWDTRRDLPPELRWRSEIVLTEALGIWLATYWKGRLLQVW